MLDLDFAIQGFLECVKCTGAHPLPLHKANCSNAKGSNVGSGQYKYVGGVLLPDGRVLLVPLNADTVGLYDVGASTASKPAYTLSQPLSPSWNAALLPYYNKY